MFSKTWREAFGCTTLVFRNDFCVGRQKQFFDWFTVVDLNCFNIVVCAKLQRNFSQDKNCNFVADKTDCENFPQQNTSFELRYSVENQLIAKMKSMQIWTRR